MLHESIQEEVNRRTAQIDELAKTILLWKTEMGTIEKVHLVHATSSGIKSPSSDGYILNLGYYKYPSSMWDLSVVKKMMRSRVEDAIRESENRLRELTRELETFMRDNNYGQ